MNLHEYLNQKNPQPLLNGSVKIELSDIKIGGSVINKHGMLMEVIKVNGIDYNYIVIEKSGMLYTQNENGNPDKETVFSLVK